jgi:hypothetical protein
MRLDTWFLVHFTENDLPNLMSDSRQPVDSPFMKRLEPGQMKAVNSNRFITK